MSNIVEPSQQFNKASIATADNLRTIAQSAMMRDLSRLSLPEIDNAVNLIGRLVPAGNVPGVILSGLARLSGRKVPFKNVKRDVNLLFHGVEQVLDYAAYFGVFAGPAAVIWGYQNLLKMVGKDIDAAFPDGTWQFYVDYALREDTARHANETHGFDSVLNNHGIQLSLVDRITAWVMAAIYCVHQYDKLLENEWRERVYLHLLREITYDDPESAYYAGLYRQWEKQRPYMRGDDVTATDDYPTYRRIKFDRFLAHTTNNLTRDRYDEWLKQIEVAEDTDLPNYLQQVSILSYLEPQPHGEQHQPIELKQACIGIVYQGQYYLLPAYHPDQVEPPDIHTVRSQVANLVQYPQTQTGLGLTPFAQMKRSSFSKLRDKLTEHLVWELDILRTAPILINFDAPSSNLMLAEIRQGERGVGDHALTIFDTGQTFVFDQSHIYFDGAWGAALAEILTNEALSWAVYLQSLPPAKASNLQYYLLSLQLEDSDWKVIRGASYVSPEVAAESDGVKLKSILALRKIFKRRNDLLELTVNDLLIMFRAIHAATYQPTERLVSQLKSLLSGRKVNQAVKSALATFEDSAKTSPAVLIPVDASQRSPRDRLYPMSFEVPLGELDLIGLHYRTISALEAYNNASGDRTKEYETFDNLQRTYLATLASFGAIMSRAKAIAITGETASVGSIKLLSHMPVPLQRLLDKIPGRFDVLNDIIKGREVLSNVGVVAPTSSLTRFITAKDDNDKKTLAWGIITDAQGVMRITLRDFRPHVAQLIEAGHVELAKAMAQDYLDAYIRTVNQYVHDLHHITLASRETRFSRPENIE